MPVQEVEKAVKRVELENLDKLENLENLREIKLLRPNEAAEMLAVSTHSLRAWAKEGKLFPCYTAGGQLRIPISEVDRLLHRDTARVDPDASPAIPVTLEELISEEDEPSGGVLPDLATLFQSEDK